MSSNPRSRPDRVESPRLRRGNAWKWISVFAITSAVVPAFKVMDTRSPVPEPLASVQFLPSVENKDPPSGSAPDGMVWIPGGEFSMGARDPVGMRDLVAMQATTDSGPVHRVHVIISGSAA